MSVTMLLERDQLLEAYEASLKDGEGRGRKPSEVYAIEMTWKPEDAKRKKTWFCMFQTKAMRNKHFEHMQRYPVADEELRMLTGRIDWAEEAPGDD